MLGTYDAPDAGKALLRALPVLLALATTAGAQSGATLTPDLRSHLVSKDVGVERWTIGLNLSSALPSSFVNVTGNVFKRDGSPPSFILCQVRSDSTGSLLEPESTIRLSCFGADACATNARDCGRTSWQPIPGAEAIELPAAFFLPPGGRGSAVVAQNGGGATPPGRLVQAWRLVARSATRLLAWLRGSELANVPRAAFAQSNDRGATLTLDGNSYLVSKDVGTERWSISLNLVPVQTEDGLIDTRLTSVTGNVFKPDGSPPSFVYCTPNPDSTGTLEDPRSEFRFSCLGTDACTGTAADCAVNEWRLISDDIPLEASFFLPPLGLPSTVQSDPDIIVIGRTSDPPAIATTDFELGDGAADRAAGGAACDEGAPCVAAIGSCARLAGTLLGLEDGGCACLVSPVPAECVRCDASEAESCGTSCSYPVGARGSTARGYCLPYSADTADCACYAVGAGQGLTTQRCGGTLGASCPDERCCADDPTDGCQEEVGNTACRGVCVAADECGSADSCGICFASNGAVCGNRIREGAEECDRNDLGGASCQILGLSGDRLTCNPDCTLDTSGCGVCGNGARESGEQCDGSDLGGATCTSLGFDTGLLRCGDQCAFDTSSCRDCTSGGMMVSCM